MKFALIDNTTLQTIAVFDEWNDADRLKRISNLDTVIISGPGQLQDTFTERQTRTIRGHLKMRKEGLTGSVDDFVALHPILSITCVDHCGCAQRAWDDIVAFDQVIAVPTVSATEEKPGKQAPKASADPVVRLIGDVSKRKGTFRATLDAIGTGATISQLIEKLAPYPKHEVRGDVRRAAALGLVSLEA